MELLFNSDSFIDLATINFYFSKGSVVVPKDIFAKKLDIFNWTEKRLVTNLALHHLFNPYIKNIVTAMEIYEK